MSGLVDAVDLSAFYPPYEGDGRRDSPYDPRVMARKLEEDVAFLMLAAGKRLVR